MADTSNKLTVPVSGKKKKQQKKKKQKKNLISKL